jgi:hypothetical protein
MAAHQVDAALFQPHVAAPSGETLSFEGASTRSCVSRKVLLTIGLANMPRSESGQFQTPNDVRGDGSFPRKWSPGEADRFTNAEEGTGRNRFIAPSRRRRSMGVGRRARKGHNR